MPALTYPRPPPFELFFAPLEVELTPNQVEEIQFAYFASKYGHAKQKRDDGARYFDHPKAAAWIYIEELAGRDVRTIVDILLHDLGEDAYLLSPLRLKINFGIDVALDIHALTKLPKGKESTQQYLERVIRRGPRAVVAKLCDRLHNLRTVGTCSPEKQRAQVEETQAYHLPLLIRALSLSEQPWAQCGDSLECKIEKAIEAIDLT